MSEALYSALASALISICPNTFAEAKISAEVHDDWSEKSYHCKTGEEWSKGLRSDASDDFAVDNALHALRKSMTIPGQQPWSRCTFTLFPDGKFKFDVEYDD